MLVPIPDLMSARRLLCIQPHYDDNDIGCGGTLARLAAEGCEITYLTVADDLLGVLDPALSDAAARDRLEAEQRAAGEIIGVGEQVRLDYPDAGAWDHQALRLALVREIRRVAPDFVVTVDPWLATEAHLDHVRTGQAALEAVLLHGLPRYRTDPVVDAAAAGATVRGVGLYFTGRPNRWFDIAPGREAKHRALDCYRAQFTEDGLRVLHAALDHKEQAWGQRAGVLHGEALQVLHPAHLHCNPDADEMEVAG